MPSFFFFIKTLQPLRIAALATYGRRGRSCRRKYHSKQRSEKGACLSFMRRLKSLYTVANIFILFFSYHDSFIAKAFPLLPVTRTHIRFSEHKHSKSIGRLQV